MPERNELFGKLAGDTGALFAGSKGGRQRFLSETTPLSKDMDNSSSLNSSSFNGSASQVPGLGKQMSEEKDRPSAESRTLKKIVIQHASRKRGKSIEKQTDKSIPQSSSESSSESSCSSSGSSDSSSSS